MSDQEMNIKLVGAVEKHEALYNYKLPDYSRKDVTEKAWKEVAAEVNMPGKKRFYFAFFSEILLHRFNLSTNRCKAQ